MLAYLASSLLGQRYVTVTHIWHNPMCRR